MKRLVLALVVVVTVATVGFASAAQLGVTTASLTALAAPVPQPPALALAVTNGGSVAGRPELDDVVTITLPQAVDATTICPTWTNGTTVQSINTDNAVTVSVVNGGTGNDSLTVATTCTGWSFGTVNLGATGFVTTTATFRGTKNNRSSVAYDPTSRVLTIVLGSRASGSVGTVAGPVTSVFTPAAGLKWQDGNTVAPSAGSSTRVQF